MLFWLPLAVLAVCVIGGIAYAVVRGIQLYREAKRVGDAFGTEMDRVNASVAEIEAQLRKADEARVRLEAAADRLAVARATLNVQVAAVREARSQVRRVFWFVPGI